MGSWLQTSFEKSEVPVSVACVAHGRPVHRRQIWRTTRSTPGGLQCLLFNMLPHRSLVSSTIWSVLFRYAPLALTTTPPKQTHSRAKPANYADNGGRSITSPFFSEDAYSFSILLSRFACNSLSPTPHPRVLRARIARFFFCVHVRL